MSARASTREPENNDARPIMRDVSTFGAGRTYIGSERHVNVPVSYLGAHVPTTSSHPGTMVAHVKGKGGKNVPTSFGKSGRQTGKSNCDRVVERDIGQERSVSRLRLMVSERQRRRDAQQRRRNKRRAARLNGLQLSPSRGSNGRSTMSSKRGRSSGSSGDSSDSGSSSDSDSDGSSTTASDLSDLMDRLELLRPGPATYNTGLYYDRLRNGESEVHVY